MKEVRAILAAVAAGKTVSLERIENACIDMNDFRGHNHLKQQIRDLRDKMISQSHMKGLW